MKWIKKGLIYSANNESSWARHSALTPTPFLLEGDVIRVFCSFRDSRGVGRVGFVDVDASDPSKIINVSQDPVLDVGPPGTFDDNGIILGDILRVGESLHLYYVGFQLVEKVKFLAFTGLAISSDNGNSFQRFSRTPILDRSDDALYFRAIHSICKIGDKYRAWIGAGSEWEEIGGKPFPKYNVRSVESDDGISFGANSEPCFDFQGNEYRLGRPRVLKTGSSYQMFYTIGTTDTTYLPGYAESSNGVAWTRKDSEIGIGVSSDGWDSLHLSYLAPIRWRDRVYAFFNGNNMGLTGFGWAELERNTSTLWNKKN